MNKKSAFSPLVTALRWIIFLPIAIGSSALFSGGFNYISHLILPDWRTMKLLSASIWLVTGYLTPLIWMAVGYAVAPIKTMW